MSRQTDWEERKRALCNVWNLRRKIAQLFPQEDADELEGVLWGAWQWENARLGLAILRQCDAAKRAGHRNYLDELVRTAQRDYRDVLVGEYTRQMHLRKDATAEQEQGARDADARECIDWLMS